MTDTTEARRDLARRVFWSDHALCRACARAHAGAFSLRQLLAYAEALPAAAFARLAHY
jgi:hypothetical protein